MGLASEITTNKGPLEWHSRDHPYSKIEGFDLIKVTMKKELVIEGVGPSGLATATCLNMLSIPNIILEKENYSASLWRMRAYDRLKLHIAKQFYELPRMPYPRADPTFLSKDEFIQYLHNY